MGRFVDSLITYRILRLLTTPFEETDAYRLGIIDAKGKELKKMSQLNNSDEQNAYTILHRLVFRLKKIVEKVPIDNKKIVSYAAALALIKECVDLNKEPVNLENLYLEVLHEQYYSQKHIHLIHEFLDNKHTLTFKQFLDEEIPANNAGTPGVAGFTPDTVGVPVSVQRKMQRKREKLFRRSEVKNVGVVEKSIQS